MSWLTLSIEVERGRVEAAEAALLDSGALSVTLSDAGDSPLLENAPGETPLWPSVRLTGLFPADADPDGVRLRLAATLGDRGLAVTRMDLPDREWTRAWLDRFGPMRFGRRLWIVPRGTAVPGPEAVAVRLDPGLAFGTGTHPTTALCLEWLDAHPPRGLTVLDYGCGSGVLGIAAACLGATEVLCVDHDPQALAATRDNAAVNGVQDAVHAFDPDDLPRARVDLILANILHQPLLALVPSFAERLVPGGPLVMSGILPGQADELVAACRPLFGGFSTEVRDGWARVSAHRLH